MASMQTKSQVSIVIAIVSVLLIGSIFFFMNAKEEQPSLAADLQPVVSFVETCLKDQAESGLLFLGSQGGFYERMRSENYLSLSIPYYLEGNATSVPSLEHIEQELNFYIQDNLEYCIDNFESMDWLGIAVQALEQPVVKSSVGEKDVTINLEYPLKITQGTTTSEQRSFVATVSLNFKHIHSIVGDVMDQQKSEVLALHMGFLAKSAYDNDYFFELIQLDEQTVIFSFKFENEKLRNEPYYYNFAQRYDW